MICDTKSITFSADGCLFGYKEVKLNVVCVLDYWALPSYYLYHRWRWYYI